MGSRYGDRGSAVTGIFAENWIKADGFVKPQTGVIRFSLLNTDWRMIVLDDTGAEEYTQQQARFEQCGRSAIWVPQPAHGTFVHADERGNWRLRRTCWS